MLQPFFNAIFLPMNLTITHQQGANLLLAEGTILEADFQLLADEIEKLPFTEDKYVLVDCASIRHLIKNNYGFSGYINNLLHLHAKKTSIILFGNNPQVLRLTKLLRLDHILYFAPTLDEAYTLLNKALIGRAAEATGEYA